MKLMCIYGTRPEAIKMASVIRQAAQQDLELVVVFTGQHSDMVQPIEAFFGIRRTESLEVMGDNQHISITLAKLLTEIHKVVLRHQPDWILAQGDTLTTLAAAIVAHFHQRKFGHVEAGLRSDNFQHPFPEEFSRRIADIHADLYFAPTQRAQENLRRENIPAEKVHLTGNTVNDALHWAARQKFAWANSPLAQFAETTNKVLITAHRRENFSAAHANLFSAVTEIAREYPDWHFIYPVHLNPNVQDAAAVLQNIENVHLIEPLDYLSFVNLMRTAKFIISDSGGVQEEAPMFEVPVLIIRETTERPEAVESGHNFLVGTREQDIYATIKKQIANPRQQRKDNPYPFCDAGMKIIHHLKTHTNGKP